MKVSPLTRGILIYTFWSLVLLSGLVAIQQNNYLLFHSVAECFSIIVAAAIFVLAWNTRRDINNGYLLFVGIAYAFVAGLDMLHTFSYKNVGILPSDGANLPTQFWMAARGLQALSLLIAPLFLTRRANPHAILSAYAGILALILLSLFHWRCFPVCFDAQTGLTAFKVYGEYVICVLLLGALAMLLARRQHFSRRVLGLVASSIAITIVSELAFTRYTQVSGFANMVGHLLKFAAFYLLYKALVETGLRHPYELLFRDLQASESRYRALVEHSPQAVFVNVQNRVEFVNPAAVRLFGAATVEQLLGRSPFELFHPDYHAVMRARIGALLDGETVPLIAGKIVRLDGETREVEVTAVSYEQRAGRAIQVILRDVTDRNRLEAQMALAQRMESVGQLAGGIAHEFNNLLTVVLGYAEIAEMELPPASPALEPLQRIQTAAARAAELTGQLLSYARRQMIQPQVLSLNEILSRLEAMLRRLLGAGVTLEIRPAPALWRIQADPGLIEQLLVNLALNARDAMPQGGRLLIVTRNQPGGLPDPSGNAGPPSSDGVELMVQDTGCGMSEEVQARLFEPFFTTKEVGKGTGLGLATCYGIVKQHQGEIQVASRSGEGTTFTMRFPRLVSEGQEATVPPPPTPRRTILLVEDEATVRSLATTALRAAGCTVLEAANGREGLEIAREHAGRLDLLLTDIVMPEMDGRTLAAQAQALAPDLPVLFMTGYAEHMAEEEVLAKPFRPTDLVRAVQARLDGRTGKAAG